MVGVVVVQQCHASGVPHWINAEIDFPNMPYGWGLISLLLNRIQPSQKITESEVQEQIYLLTKCYGASGRLRHSLGKHETSAHIVLKERGIL